LLNVWERFFEIKGLAPTLRLTVQQCAVMPILQARGNLLTTRTNPLVHKAAGTNESTIAAEASQSKMGKIALSD
jgi:hypothetical protein